MVKDPWAMRWGDRVGEREWRVGEESSVGGALNLGLRRMFVSFSHIHMCTEFIEHPLFVECGERLFWSSTPELIAALCTEWKGMDYEGFIFCKANSSIFVLVHNAQNDLISSELALYSFYVWSELLTFPHMGSVGPTPTNSIQRCEYSLSPLYFCPQSVICWCVTNHSKLNSRVGRWWFFSLIHTVYFLSFHKERQESEFS